MGLPMPGFEMSIIDEDGCELPPGELGHLAQRPSEQGYYALGYWRGQERTRALFRHGWITAGDLARRDEAGTSGSRGGPTMSSRAPDTASDHSRSKAQFCITLQSPKPLSWANRIH